MPGGYRVHTSRKGHQRQRFGKPPCDPQRAEAHATPIPSNIPMNAAVTKDA